jgi:cytochrome c6
VLVAALLVGLSLLVSWPRSAYGASGEPLASGQHLASGEQLFEAHCAGCHINGGNILRRGKTLKLAALHRNGIEGPELIATIAAAGIGQMGGYGEVLGEGGPELVGEWVWQQALANWSRPDPNQKA